MVQNRHTLDNRTTTLKITGFSEDDVGLLKQQFQAVGTLKVFAVRDDATAAFATYDSRTDAEEAYTHGMRVGEAPLTLAWHEEDATAAVVMDAPPSEAAVTAPNDATSTYVPMQNAEVAPTANTDAAPTDDTVETAEISGKALTAVEADAMDTATDGAPREDVDGIALVGGDDGSVLSAADTSAIDDALALLTGNGVGQEDPSTEFDS